ncbi:hypothetical protein Droror1_Dr00000891 [Drosera rotundifolia]
MIEQGEHCRSKLFPVFWLKGLATYIDDPMKNPFFLLSTLLFSNASPRRIQGLGYPLFPLCSRNMNCELTTKLKNEILLHKCIMLDATNEKSGTLSNITNSAHHKHCT